MRPRGWLAVPAALLMLLPACTDSPGVGARQPDDASQQPTQTAKSQVQGTALAAQKKEAGIADCPTSDSSVAAVGEGLPDVVLPCLGGGRDVRLAGLRGRPMLVNVWAQWCGPCRAEAPYLAEAARENTSKLMILGVDYLDGVQPDAAIEFAHVSGWRYPQVADPDKVIAAPLQILGPPYTFFVRADGTISAKHVGGFTSADQIRELARQHLGVAW
jgi:cytochrome c biogenesis protein CcmG/thiol:disulfide interchange protein DsbE